jgi:hypothetical protein
MKIPSIRIAGFLLAVFMVASWSWLSGASSFDNRKQDLVEKAIDLWAPHYDSDIRMVRGKHSTRDSAWLALCYFIKGTDLARANELLRGVIGVQVHEGERAGNFKWHPRDDDVLDQNCAPFIVPSLAYIRTYHAHALEPDVKISLTDCLVAAETCIINLEEHIPVWYSNIYLSMVDALVMLGNETKALEWTNQYYDFIQEYGINEYGAWNYDIVELAALQNALSHAQNPELKDKLEELLEFHWYMLVHQMHQSTLMISSTASRAKASSGLRPTDSVAMAYYLYFGDGKLADFHRPRVELLLSDYQPAPEIHEIYRNKKSNNTEWQARFGRVDAHVYQTPEYSLATQSGRRSSLGIRDTTKVKLSNARQEADIQLVVNNASQRKGVRFRTAGYRPNDDDFTHHWITSVQKKNKAVVSFNHDPQGAQGVAIYSEAPLGDYTEISGVQINGADWDGEPTALATSDCLAYRMGETYVGFRFLETDVMWIENHEIVSESSPLFLRREAEGGLDVILLTSYLAYNTEEMRYTGQDRRLGYVIEIAGASEYGTLGDFSRHLAGIEIEQNVEAGIHTVSVASGGDTLHLREDLPQNIILSRTVNGVEYDNGFMLRSKYVSYPVGKNFARRTVSTAGELPYPPPAPPPERYVFLHYEAEGMSLMGPMRRQKDPDASNGYSIKTIQHKNGEAARGVVIPYNGEWRVWVRAFWKDGSSNSCYIRFNDDNVGFEKEILTSDVYGIYHWLQGPVFRLHRGVHILKLEGREVESIIDKVLITNDPSFRPE